MRAWTLVFFGILGSNFSSQATSLSLMPLMGQNLFSVDQKITIDAQGKKGTMVVFLSATCPCSSSRTPELITLAKAYPDFAFVAVHSNSNENLETAQVYFKAAHLPFPVIQDQNSKLADQFKALKTPHAFVLLPSGELVYQGGGVPIAPISAGLTNAF